MVVSIKTAFDEAQEAKKRFKEIAEGDRVIDDETTSVKSVSDGFVIVAKADADGKLPFVYDDVLAEYANEEIDISDND